MPLQPFVKAFGQEKGQSTVTQDQEIMDQPSLSKDEQDKEAQTAITVLDSSSVNSSQDNPSNTLPPVPLQMKLLSVLLVSCIALDLNGAVESALP